MVDIIIVNWNSGQQLFSCLQSIDKAESKLCHKVIVVDNFSEDGSTNGIQGLSNVELIKSDFNLGFGKACNLGSNFAKSELLLFLNPDAELFPDTLGKALAFMRAPANKDVGICGVQLIDMKGKISKSCSRFPTPFQYVSHVVGLDKIAPHLCQFMAEWPHDSTRDVDQIMGAFFLVRRKLFEILGGFDEQFFVYFEEVDFSYRAHQAGWRSVYLAEAQALHVGGGTSNQVKAKRLFYSLRSRLLYSFKHFSIPGALTVLMVTLIFEPVSRSILAISMRSWPFFKETWQGYGMLWRWLPQWLFKGVTR